MSDILASLQKLDRMQREPLQLFRPVTVQQYLAASCDSLELLISGGNRSGKTYLALMMFASRVLGIPLKTIHAAPYLVETINKIANAANQEGDFTLLRHYLSCSGGKQLQDIPLKFPVPTPAFPRLYWILGRDQDHIGSRIYKFLFQPGHVKLIKDIDTGRLRIYNPADPLDKCRESEAVGAEPIIPERFIVPGSWKWVRGKKGLDVFSEVTLINGAVIRAYGTQGQPTMGDEVDGALIDEDLTNEAWLGETQRRLLNRDGWFIWAVWPQMKNFAVLNLQQRVKNKDPHIKEFTLTFSDNPFATKAQKARSDAMAGSEEEIRRRDFGETLADKLTMYQVDDEMHGLGNPDRARELITDVSTERRQIIFVSLRSKIEKGLLCSRQELLTQIWDDSHSFPPEWTRYISIDPSNTRTGVVFGVVPPPEVCGVKMGRTVIIENELVREQCNAVDLARDIKEIAGNLSYEAFIMDKRYGRMTHGGRDNTTFENYENAFAGARLYSRLTKYGFEPGIDVPSFRYRVVREFIDGSGGVPDLYYVRYHTPHLQHEFQTYRKKRIAAQDGTVQIMDEPANPRKYDVMAALEYLLAYLEGPFTMGVAYQPPEAYVIQEHEAGLPDLVKDVLAARSRPRYETPEALNPFFSPHELFNPY